MNRPIATVLFVAMATVHAAVSPAEAVTIETGFATNGEIRVFRDFSMEKGMADHDGLEFDFACDDLAALSGFTVYFKSGSGWYSASVPIEHARQHVRVPKSDAVMVDGNPSGWRNVTAYRVCGWRGAKRNASFTISDVRKYREKARVLVLRTESKNAYGNSAEWAQRLAVTLRALGIYTRHLMDSDFTDASFADMKIIALPYNPSLEPQTLKALKRFVSGGGKLLACFTLPSEMGELFGLRRTRMFSPRDEHKLISGFLRNGKGLDGQPAFSPQCSWLATVVEPQGEADVVAEWADAERKSLGIPAIIRTPHGIFISHIWQGGISGEPLELMQSMLGSLAPELRRDMAGMFSCAAQHQADQLCALRRIGLKGKEMRGVWCHTPYGYDDEHDWESTVRMMKRIGFTDLFANLCWGGDAAYSSKVLPATPEVAQRGDALELCRTACRRHGIKLHVWKVCWRLNNKMDAKHKVALKTDGRFQVRFDGSDDMNWLCPSNPKNMQTQVESMLELAQRDVDGIHFDYIRYRDVSGCFCDSCRRRFEARYGVVVDDWPRSIRSDGGLKKKWNDFRCDNITAVVREVAEHLHGRSGVQISAAVCPNIDSCRDSMAQDWTRWCREGWLDFVCPMNYTLSAEFFRSMAIAQMENVGGTTICPGIGLSCWREDGEDVCRLGKQIQVVRDLGLSGFMVFSLCRRTIETFSAF